MPKINQEEYGLLKELDDKWKWIARDKDRCLYVLTEKPVRKDGPSSYWGWIVEPKGPYAALELFDERHLFQFIQWEDEEPYNIAELIEEYEDSKEYKDSLVIEYFLDKAKESEETEVKNIEELKSWFEEDKFYEGEYVKHKIDQLDEPEVLSQEWIDEHQELQFYEANDTADYFVRSTHLQNLLVPKREENSKELSNAIQYVIDEFNRLGELERQVHVLQKLTLEELVVELKNGATISKVKKNATNENVGENIGWALNKIDKYLSIEGNNEARNALVFAKGVINQLGHKVGNLKYYVLDTEDIPMLVRTHGVVNRANTHLSIHEKGRNTEHYQLTEQEIKDYDERYWPFAVKVEELEE